MKVYVKKKDRESMIPGVIIMITFIAVSTGIFVSAFNYDGSFMEFLESAGILILFGVVFFAFGNFFLYMLVKRPKGYRVKLTSKKAEIYKGKQITYMEFSVRKNPDEEPIKSKYNCYTIGENDLIEGKDYVLKIKEFNWNPKKICDLNEYYENKMQEAPSKIPEMQISPVLFAIGFIFGGMTLFCILGIITHPEYLAIYILLGIIFGSVTYFTFNIDKALKTFEKYEKKDINSNDDSSENQIESKKEDV